jgi:hypothetical protein
LQNSRFRSCSEIYEIELSCYVFRFFYFPCFSDMIPNWIPLFFLSRRKIF